MFSQGYQVYVLDGDALRTGLNSDLGFSDADRNENMRRVGEVARLLADAGQGVIVALISPFREGRALARRVVGEGFHEIYVKADLDTCEARDPKGLYRRARQGQLAQFTGVSSGYDVPDQPEYIIDTQQTAAATAASDLFEYIQSRVRHPLWERAERFQA